MCRTEYLLLRENYGSIIREKNLKILKKFKIKKIAKNILILDQYTKNRQWTQHECTVCRQLFERDLWAMVSHSRVRNRKKIVKKSEILIENRKKKIFQFRTLSHRSGSDVDWCTKGVESANGPSNASWLSKNLGGKFLGILMDVGWKCLLRYRIRFKPSLLVFKYTEKYEHLPTRIFNRAG